MEPYVAQTQQCAGISNPIFRNLDNLSNLHHPTKSIPATGQRGSDRRTSTASSLTKESRSPSKHIKRTPFTDSLYSRCIHGSRCGKKPEPPTPFSGNQLISLTFIIQPNQFRQKFRQQNLPEFQVIVTKVHIYFAT